MSGYIELCAELIRNILPVRTLDSNKGSYGKVLNIAGSLNYQGAAYLSSVSSLKVGAGLVSLATIETVINNISALTPNLTFFKLRDSYSKCIASDSFAELVPILGGYNVVSIGSGLSLEPAVMAFVSDFIKYFADSSTSIVMDADALNSVAESGFCKLPVNTIITPHPKELSRLLRCDVERIQEDRISAAKAASEKFGCLTVLKGYRTVICTPNFEIFINTTGNSALAKAGSGDVLVGMITGFLAQGVSCDGAVKLAVFLHGLCGELAAEKLTEYSVLAQDIVDCIPLSIKSILH